MQTTPLQDLERTELQAILRSRLCVTYPRHPSLHYPAMFAVCSARALELWRQELVPQLGREPLTKFELALAEVGMMARRTIPWSMVSGYAYGATCAELAGIAKDSYGPSATTAGLGTFILSLFDKLLDEYPAVFGNMGDLIRDGWLELLLTGEDVAVRWDGPDNVLLLGLKNLLRLYISRILDAARLSGSTLVEPWKEAMRRALAAELATRHHMIQETEPSSELVEACAGPSIYAYRCLALGACVSAEVEDRERVDRLADQYGRLTWMVDDLIDLEEDRQAGRWNGLAVRMAIAGTTGRSPTAVMEEQIESVTDLLRALPETTGISHWHAGDDFFLADILWGVIWAWLGGNVEPPASTRHAPVVPDRAAGARIQR